MTATANRPSWEQQPMVLVGTRDFDETGNPFTADWRPDSARARTVAVEFQSEHAALATAAWFGIKCRALRAGRWFILVTDEHTQAATQCA